MEGFRSWLVRLPLAQAVRVDRRRTPTVSQLRATVDVHIHYSFEPVDGDARHTRVVRWLLLDVTMPIVARPLRRLITSAFDKENGRTISAVKQYAERHPDLLEA